MALLDVCLTGDQEDAGPTLLGCRHILLRRFDHETFSMVIAFPIADFKSCQFLANECTQH